MYSFSSFQLPGVDYTDEEKIKHSLYTSFEEGSFSDLQITSCDGKTVKLPITYCFKSVIRFTGSNFHKEKLL